jgi:hypothetical protein
MKRRVRRFVFDPVGEEAVEVFGAATRIFTVDEVQLERVQAACRGLSKAQFDSLLHRAIERMMENVDQADLLKIFLEEAVVDPGCSST